MRTGVFIAFGTKIFSVLRDKLRAGIDREGRRSDRLRMRYLPDYDSRKRGRLKVVTDSGESAGIFLQRGMVLHDGDCLRSKDGRTVIIRAAPEPLVEATTDDSLIFAKTCYHLGNRHTPIEITKSSVRFQPDHVLADMQ